MTPVLQARNALNTTYSSSFKTTSNFVPQVKWMQEDLELSLKQFLKF